MDFKNNYGVKPPTIYIKGNQKKYFSNIEYQPDLVVRMNKDTFDDLSEKRLGGPWAYLTGRVKIT
jgi:putative sterol carrier protein